MTLQQTFCTFNSESHLLPGEPNYHCLLAVTTRSSHQHLRSVTSKFHTSPAFPLSNLSCLRGPRAPGLQYAKPQHVLGFLFSLVPQAHSLASHGDVIHRRRRLLSFLGISAGPRHVQTLHPYSLDTSWLGGRFIKSPGSCWETPRSLPTTEADSGHLPTLLVKALSNRALGCISSLICPESHSLSSERICPKLSGFFTLGPAVLLTWNSFPSILHPCLHTLFLHVRSGSDANCCRWIPKDVTCSTFHSRHACSGVIPSDAY